jgi:ABC-type Fe3+-hydroxamate transport system substrate-binding protein
MKKAVDMLGRKISVPEKPQRIISLVPSQTELLFDMGLENEVAGITKFCVHPEKWFHGKTRIGGTKNLHFEIIDEIEPDLILANKEENNQRDIEALEKKYPVWISDIHHLNDALKMIEQIGALVDKIQESKALYKIIYKKIYDLNIEREKNKALYFIWQKPWMCAGDYTFISDMMHFAGFENCLKNRKRYPEISESELKKINPDYILLSSEPFPFNEKHDAEMKKICPNSKVILVDGEMFSWYGSRLSKSADYFLSLASG